MARAGAAEPAFSRLEMLLATTFKWWSGIQEFFISRLQPAFNE
jgi:hypothetical protein